MADKISRRQILSLGAATIAGGVAVLGRRARQQPMAADRCNIGLLLDNRNLRAIVRIGRKATAVDPSM